MVEELKATSSAYAKGAVMGGVAMAVFALATKRSVLFWGTMGVIGGGFIAYKFKNVKKSSTTSKFKNYDLEPESTK